MLRQVFFTPLTRTNVHREEFFDFQSVFAALPCAAAVFTADPSGFLVLAANDALLAALRRTPGTVVGQPLAQAFFNSDTEMAQAGALTHFQASLEAVVQTGLEQRMERLRRDRQRPDGTTETRYWDAVNIPLLGPDRAVRYVLHQPTDVTSQVRSDAVVRETSAEAILERMGDAHCVLDGDFCFVHVNAAAERLLDRPREALLGRSHWEEFPASVDAPVGHALRRVVTGKVEQHITHHYAAEGYDLHLELDAYPTDEGGVALFWRDLTERVRAEQALQRAIARDAYRIALTDALRSAASAVDAQAVATRLLGDHLGASRVMYGEADEGSTETFTNHREYLRDPAMPTSLGRRRWDDFGGYVATELRAGRTLVVNEVCVHPAHSAADILAYASVGICAYVAVPLVREGRVVAYLAVNQTAAKAWATEEITLIEETAERTWAAVERARAEAALRKSEEKYHALFEQMDEAYAVVELIADPAGRWGDFRFLDVNPAFMQHTAMPYPVGCTATQLLGTPNPRWAELFGRAADTGASIRVVEEELVLGRVFDLNIFRLGEAGSRCVAVLFTDITERTHATDALKKNDRRKDEFLAMLAHELRNPLAPIRTVVALLGKRFGAMPEYQPLMEVLDRQTSQLTRLVDDLLDVSRLRQGRVTLKWTSVECGSVIDQAIETVRTLANDKSHQLRIHRPHEALYVAGDRARLVQAVTNLLHNAIKYTDPQGTITLAVSTTGQEVLLSVQDTGMGISAELLPHVFDLFVQSERSIDRSQGGLGIGLSVVQHLVEMHHGTVQAHSDGPGRGSTFEVRLPRVAPPEREVEAVAQPCAPQRILIVDDNRDAADTLALLLSTEGHKVDVAYRANDALEHLAQQPPNTVLLDIGMPDMDGYAVARAIRARYGYALRMIALTGYGAPEDRERSAAAGFDAHLVKPVDWNTLLSYLGKARAHSAEK